MISFTLDSNPWKRTFSALEKDQLPFAESKALNKITELARDAVRESLDRNFTLNPGKTRFTKGLVTFYGRDRATKTKLETKFGVNDPDSPISGENRRGWLLGRHQEGTRLSTFNPLKPFYIPTSNLVDGPTDNPPLAMYPKNLRLAERRAVDGTLGAKGRVTKRGKVQLQGKRRTFVLMPEGRPNAWGIYRRLGAKSIEMIWAFRMRISHPPRLRFYDTAQAILREKWVGVMEEELAHALRTAR